MNDVLIDTQALIWFVTGSSRLSGPARSAIDALTVRQSASVASIWEMAIKIPLGKLTLGAATLQQFVSDVLTHDIDWLPVTTEHALRVESLPQWAHRDPFDRLIAAQCLRHDLTLVSSDAAVDAYGVRRV